MGSLRDRAQSARQARELAGDRRAGTAPRLIARRAQHEYLKRNGTRLALGGLALLLVALAPDSFLPHDFLRGVVVGAAVVGVPALLWNFVVQATGTGSSMMGEQAELWTASELRKNREDRLLNHVSLAYGDIDHLVVGPGGVVAVETKWSSQPWDERDGPDRIRAAVVQVTQECRRLNLWAPFRSAGIKARPLVVLWGHGVRGWSEDERVRTVNGVTVVSGHALRDWMRERRAQPLDPAQEEFLIDALTAQVERRDRADRERSPMPRSAGEILSAVGQVIAGCGFGLVACVHALSWFGLGLHSGSALRVRRGGAASTGRRGAVCPRVADRRRTPCFRRHSCRAGRTAVLRGSHGGAVDAPPRWTGPVGRRRRPDLLD